MKASVLILMGIICSSCTPTITVAMPEKPLEINLNVKVDHKIKIEMSKDIEATINENEDIF